LFGLYFFLWSYFVGAALISACGVSASALFGLKPTLASKASFGLAHSILAVGLIVAGGYRYFVRVMEVCAVVLFISVIVCAIAVGPEWSAVLSGLFVPTVPKVEGGLSWTIALMGGVGGTLTILCYGYWIREEGRERWDQLSTCRIDLGVGYFLTALFGISMVIIGSHAAGEGKGLGLILTIGQHLSDHVGDWAGLFFLIGAWGAIFSSLLGVWQCVPILFTDWYAHSKKSELTPSARARASRWYLLLLASVPALSLLVDFKQVQKVYSVFGALFMPFVAIVLLYLNNSASVVGKDRRNGWVVNVLLAGILAFFLRAAWLQIQRKLGL
jgi:Mn2+/Fe2+ NRAMP family transporter